MKQTYLTLLFLLAFFSINATTYYVSTAGSNGNSGSLGSPWLTIQYSLDQMSSGDILNVMNGIYNEKINFPSSGLTLQKMTGHSPVIDGTGLTPIAIVEIYNVGDITIDGLEIRNNIMLDAQGILVDGNCPNITIQNCIIHDIHFDSNVNAVVSETTNAQGVIVYGSDANNAITNLNILNNELYDCRLGFSEGIAVNGNVDGFVVSGNIVHDITNIGIDIIGHEGTSSNASNDQARNGNVNNNTVYNCLSDYATSGGLYVDGGKSIVIENNTSYHNGYGVEIGCENLGKTTDDIIVRNNVFYDNEVSALAMGGFNYPDSTGKVINSKFINNTCYHNDFLNDYVGEMFLSYFENSIIENNIFYATNQNVAMYHEGTAPITSSINYNLYYSNNLGSGVEFDFAGSSYTGTSSFNTGTGYEANSQEINPQLTAPGASTPDFHLTSSSPAIDNGNPSFVVAPAEVDLDGQSRLVGSGVDCGVDEHQTLVAVTYLNGLNARVENNHVLLNWATSSAINSKYFIIERSSNGLDWKELGEINSSNSNLTQTYNFKDSSPLKGLSYYRLNEIEFDGARSYSNIAVIDFEEFAFDLFNKDESKVYTIQVNTKGLIHVLVTNLKGQVILKDKIKGYHFDINLEGYASGVYLISVSSRSQIITKKVYLK